MPRTFRKLSNTGFYHLISRGVDRTVIFYDDDDHIYFKKLIKEIAVEEIVDVCCYCLMDNHFHLLVKMNSKVFPSFFMKRVLTRYTYYYNRKYKRSDCLFQDGFKSECVENDKCFLTIFRYICNNPVKARIVDKAYDYRWSSAHELLVDGCGFTDLNYVLALIKKDEIIRALTESVDDRCADIVEDNYRIADTVAIKEFEQHYKQLRTNDIRSLVGANKTEAVSYLFSTNCSERQISRITEISRGTLRVLPLSCYFNNVKELLARGKYH